MDRFAYNYLDINGEKSNRLGYVNDTGTDYASYDDIKTGQTSGNYQYNRIGELTADVQEGMKLYWRYGDHKLQKIVRTDQDSPEVEFFYNPLGVRVGKLVKPRQNGQFEAQENWTYHYYVYDANGQLMGVYDSKLYADRRETTLEEQYIYGSDRVGVIKKGLTVYDNGVVAPSSDPLVENSLGQKRYELKNYLGTVNVTVSDRKTYDGTEDVFEAVVTNYAETYAFGMLMPNRSLNADGQKHLFHGMEHDVEVSGSGNSYTTEFRQYDPRLGRWKSIDELMQLFPDKSPYIAFANNPIVYIDPTGLAPENKGEPKVGYKCEDENGNRLVYAGNGNWNTRRGDRSISMMDWISGNGYRNDVVRYLNELERADVKVNNEDIHYNDDLNYAAIVTHGDDGEMHVTFIGRPKNDGYLIDPNQGGVTINRGSYTREAGIIDFTFDGNFNSYWDWSGYRVQPGYIAMEAPDVSRGGFNIFKMARNIWNISKSIRTAKSFRNAFKTKNIFKSSEEHIFSRKHLKGGIMDLGKTRTKIMKQGAKSIKKNWDALKEGDNVILTEINGFETTVTVNIKNGSARGMNMFKGHKKITDNSKANIIYD
jgi:RHS repeat-associated protein